MRTLLLPALIAASVGLAQAATPAIRTIYLDAPGAFEALDDCGEGGASVSFMLQMKSAKAEAFWRGTSASVARGERVVLAAEDPDGTIVGTVQVILNQPENQPHRGDVAKMLVHRRARRRGVGAALLAAAERSAAGGGKTLLVL